MASPPGQRLSCPVAHFRLDRREEMTIRWDMLSADTIIVIIGEFLIFLF